MKLTPYRIVELMIYRNHLLASYQAMDGGKFSSATYEIDFMPGKKYIRVVAVSGGSRSSHSFIDKTGKIWKSASWRRPAKNFPRGIITDPGSWGKIHWNGIH